MKEQLEHLAEIRSLMDRSSKFISLSGLSGVAAGSVALVGAFIADRLLRMRAEHVLTFREMLLKITVLACIVVIVAFFSAYYFTKRKADSLGLTIWNSTSKKLIKYFLVPLFLGGVLCISFMLGGERHFLLVFPVTLVVYGMALISASAYTVHDTFYLGIVMAALGIILYWIKDYYVVTWALGFGVAHIVYGLIMYFRDERPQNN
ncbi:MAG: hypothetical protein ACRCVT_09850 [Leadbetterella sp.]